MGRWDSWWIVAGFYVLPAWAAPPMFHAGRAIFSTSPGRTWSGKAATLQHSTLQHWVGCTMLHHKQGCQGLVWYSLHSTTLGGMHHVTPQTGVSGSGLVQPPLYNTGWEVPCYTTNRGVRVWSGTASTLQHGVGCTMSHPEQGCQGLVWYSLHSTTRDGRYHVTPRTGVSGSGLVQPPFYNTGWEVPCYTPNRGVRVWSGTASILQQGREVPCYTTNRGVRVWSGTASTLQQWVGCTMSHHTQGCQGLVWYSLHSTTVGGMYHVTPHTGVSGSGLVQPPLYNTGWEVPCYTTNRGVRVWFGTASTLQQWVGCTMSHHTQGCQGLVWYSLHSTTRGGMYHVTPRTGVSGSGLVQPPLYNTGWDAPCHTTNRGVRVWSGTASTLQHGMGATMSHNICHHDICHHDIKDHDLSSLGLSLNRLFPMGQLEVEASRSTQGIDQMFPFC